MKNQKKFSKNNIIIRFLFILAVIIIWELLYLAKIWPSILFPSIGSIFKALIESFSNRSLGNMIVHSLKLLIEGLLIGIITALVFSSLAMISYIFNNIYELIVSTFDLIPGIALIPIAILWFGIGDAAIIFMVFHSVVWPLSRAIIDGFNSIPKIYLEVGENIGLFKAKLVWHVLIPSALPRIFSGIKIGWARAWRGLISAEMVFGGGSALGIGYFITDRRTNLDIASIFAVIIVIVLIGIIIEYGLFYQIEKRTFKKWGMVR